MAIDTGGMIILVSFFIIYGVFLCWDFFRRGEKWGFLAYIFAVIPVNILWANEYDILLVYVILFSLWMICLLRDLILVYGKTKEYDDILLFLLLGVLIQVILTAILPYSFSVMQTNCTPWWVFWFPNIYNPNTNAVNDWVNLNYLTAFRITATILVFLAVLPMLLELKNMEHVPLGLIIFVIGLFLIPSLWLAYVWMGGVGWYLMFLFAVIFLIILLLLTREK